MPSSLYEWLYRLIKLLHIPIRVVFGTHPELTELVETGRIEPGRAIELGCGAGRESIYLAKQGFDVTGIDISPTAIAMAKRAADEQAIEVRFVVEDVTNLSSVQGPFDLLVDYGTLNDLNSEQRDRYMENVLPLAGDGSQYVLMCFERRLSADEINLRFGRVFNIETISYKAEAGTRRGITIYLMEKS